MPFPYTSGNGSVMLPSFPPAFPFASPSLSVCVPVSLTSRPTFSHFAAPFVRSFSPVALPLPPFFRGSSCPLPDFFRLPHPSPHLPPDFFAPCCSPYPSFFAGCPASAPIFHSSSCLPARIFPACRTLRSPFFAGRLSLIPAFRPSHHSLIRFFLRQPRPFLCLFPGNLPPRLEKRRLFCGLLRPNSVSVQPRHRLCPASFSARNPPDSDFTVETQVADLQ